MSSMEQVVRGGKTFHIYRDEQGRYITSWPAPPAHDQGFWSEQEKHHQETGEIWPLYEDELKTSTLKLSKLWKELTSPVLISTKDDDEDYQVLARHFWGSFFLAYAYKAGVLISKGYSIVPDRELERYRNADKARHYRYKDSVDGMT